MHLSIAITRPDGAIMRMALSDGVTPDQAAQMVRNVAERMVTPMPLVFDLPGEPITVDILPTGCRATIELTA